MKRYLDGQTREQYEQGVRSAAFTKYMVTNPSDLQTLIQWGLASDPKTVSGAMIEMVSEDLRPELADIKSPTYTRLFFGANKPLLLRSLNYLQEWLDPTVFFRANRKQIINMKFIEGIDQWPNGGYRVKLRGGFEVIMSRRQAQNFQEATKI